MTFTAGGTKRETNGEALEELEAQQDFSSMRRHNHQDLGHCYTYEQIDVKLSLATVSSLWTSSPHLFQLGLTLI